MFDNTKQNSIIQDTENEEIKDQEVNKKVYVPAKYLMSISIGKKANTDAVDDGKYIFFTGGKECSKINTSPYDFESIIISKVRCVGNLKIHYICGEKFDATANAMIHHNFDEKKIIPKFFYYFAKSNFSNYIRKLGIPVVTFPQSSLENFRNFPVLVPSLEQQQKAVHFLDIKVPALKKMKEMFHQLSAELKKYEDSITGKVKDFDHLIKKACKTTEKIAYEKIPAKYLMSISIGKKLNQDAVDDGKYNLFVGGKKCLKINTAPYDCESIIISKVECIGHLHIHHVCNEKFDATTHAVIHDRFNLTKIIPKFFYYFAKSNFSNYVRALGIPTVSVPKTSLENFRNFPILVPPLDKQRKIVEFLDIKSKSVCELKNKIKESIEQLNKCEIWMVRDRTSNPS